jgi:PAS domain S-box-containing protein
VQMQMIPPIFVASAIFIVVMEYVGQGQRLTRTNLAFLMVEPLLAVGFMLSSRCHQLFRYNFRLDFSSPLPVMLTDKGLIFWVHNLYSFGLIILSCGILLTAFRIHTLYQRNTLFILLGILIPLTSSTLYTFDIMPIRGFDPTPMMFVVTGVLYVWALLRFRLFDVVPIARNTVMESMDDIYIVLDIHGNIADLNRAAQTALALSLPKIGSSPTTLSQPWAGLFQRHADTSSCKEEITLEFDGSNRAYELTVSQIQDKQTHNLGRYFLFHDITNRRRAETEEREQRILAEALRDTAEALNSTLDFDGVLETILKNVGRVVPIDSANIALLEGRHLHYVRFHGYQDRNISEKEMETMSVSLDSSPILIKVFETGQPVIIPDTHADPDWIITPIGAWIRSYAVMPIRVKEEVVGVLNLDSAVLGFYTPEHIYRLRAFANQVAIAIENARLFATAELEIKERKQVEEKLRQLSRAVEQSPVSIVITDTTGKIEYVNPRFTEVTGYKAEEVVGHNPRILKTDKTPSGTHSQLWETITSGREWHGEFVNRKKNGEEYYESASISPITSGKPSITGSTGCHKTPAS